MFTLLSNRRIKGFTLVEMMIVLGIIGILTTVVLASTSIARTKSRDTKRQADMKEIQLALALYFDVNRLYPASLATLVSQKYIPQLPIDPSGTDYEYLSASPFSTYCIGVKLESAIPSDNVNCTSAASNQTANYTAKPPVN